MLSQYKFDNTMRIDQFNDDKTMQNIAMDMLITKKMYFLIENNDIKSFIMIWPYKKDNYVAIGELFTNPIYRGRGYGTLMINYSEYLGLNKYGVKFITMGVEKYNTVAYNLYTKLGFKKYKTWSDYSQENVIKLNKILTL